MTHHRSVIGSLVLLVVVAAGLEACGDDTTFGTTATTAAPTTTAPTTTAPTTTAEAPTTSASTSTSSSTTAAAPPGCAGGPTMVPAGAVSTAVVDVDGDGLEDTAWLIVQNGTVRVGIVTSAGGGAERLWNAASPAPRSVLVADADGHLPVEIFASDQREVQLWQFRDCALQDVVGTGGEPFMLSLGFGPIGTGVGCVVIGGAMELVRLDVVSSDATSVTWSRTIINVVDGVATDGATQTGTFSRPADDAAIALLHEVSCGELTMRDDGITAHES